MTTRWLAVTLLAASLVSACGAFAGSPEPCAAELSLQIGSGAATPVCSFETSLRATGGAPTLDVEIKLPADGPYGSGDTQAILSVFGIDLGGTRRHVSSVLYLDGGRGHDSLFFSDTNGARIGASGPCTAGARGDAIELACDLTTATGASLPLSGTLGPVPNPSSVPDAQWLEVRYKLEGALKASGTVTVAADAHDLQRGIFGLVLADGTIVHVVPAGNDQGKVAWLTLPAPHPTDDIIWLPDEQTPSLGRCVVTVSSDRRGGSLSCPGDRSSLTGSVALELSWRPVP